MKNIHPQELVGTGLAPEDFELLNSQIRPELARKKGYHPDDQHREEHMERHDSK